MLLQWRGAQSIRGIETAQILVDRGNGKIEFLTFTSHGRFTDHHPLPVRACVWTYYVQYAQPDGTPVGVQSEASVAVKPVARPNA